MSGSGVRGFGAWVFLAGLMGAVGPGCLNFPGKEGEACTEQGVCGTGLACDPEERVCADAAAVVARYCASAECGDVQGIDCGSCAGATEVCRENRCVYACESDGGPERCGSIEGIDCGTCTGATELCQSNQCVDVCAAPQAGAGRSCGVVDGIACGGCTGATEVCQSNQCVDVCAGLQCGTVSGVGCGTCGAARVCEANRCVISLPASAGAYLLIRAGTFTMGSPTSEPDRRTEETQRSVTLTRDFYLKETEVTQGQWRALMGSNPSCFQTPLSTQCSSGSTNDSAPVEQVSWFDAVDYVNALSRSVGLAECYGGTGTTRTFLGLSCRGFRLPTEAEWEYAARAGSLTSTYNGNVTAGYTCNADAVLTPIAWYCGNSGNRTQPVRQKQANAWGLYDMVGNVWEWTHDWYGAYGGAATDPVGPSTGSNRVGRGGSWISSAANCRAAVRGGYDPGYRYNALGFRPARSATLGP